MKLKQIPKEELELMGYDDIALLILQESGKKMKLRDIFAKVINVLGLTEETIDEELMEFFESEPIFIGDEEAGEWKCHVVCPFFCINSR